MKTWHRGRRESNVSTNLEDWSLNVHGCSTLEGKSVVIGRMLVEQKFGISIE